MIHWNFCINGNLQRLLDCTGDALYSLNNFLCVAICLLVSDRRLLKENLDGCCLILHFLHQIHDGAFLVAFKDHSSISCEVEVSHHRGERIPVQLSAFMKDDVREYVEILNRDYKSQNRPYHVVQRPNGYVMQLRPRFAGLREKMFGGAREARLNQPALDVLSLIAYRQPIGKSEIDTIRGQDSAGVVRQLVRLGLAAVAERATGERETLYGTTDRFLEIFNLKSLEDLPVVGEAKKVT